MSGDERRITDTPGRFLQVVRNGRTLDDADWTTGRILLSNRRLVLASEGGKRTIQLRRIGDVGDRYDVNQRVARESDYVSLELRGNDVVLVAPDGYDGFDVDVYGAMLDQEVVLTRHPAVEGGVVQDTEWEKARITLESDTLNVGTEGGAFVEVDLDDIGGVETDVREVVDETRSVVEVEHTEGGTSVETYFSGPDRHCSVLRSLFATREERNEAEFEIAPSEKQVLMALYSGVSPFEIPDFTGLSIEEVEDTFDRLIELGVLDEVRKRREVALTPRGRNVASQAINEE